VTETAQVPSGTITLLFTDIEGSTRLWEAEPDAMTVALRRHDEILRGSIEQAGGYVFKTVGDAFCAAFGTAPAAVTAVLAAQQALTTQEWPTSRPVRVRMGLHTGACEERDGDYFGPVVNRSARLEAVAHGGQVLISGVTAELLSGMLADGAGLRDLGQHRLKDLGRPEHVFQLTAGFLPAAFPPLASLDNPELPNNLPGVVSAFVGRESELGEVRQLLTSSRMVTLAGAGGSGKTRLALQVAAELVGSAGDGVWLCELAPLTDGDQIAGVLAGLLRLPDQGGAAPLQAVAAALGGQDVVLILDNCEHLIDDAARVSDELLRSCPRVRVLATSREPLGIDGERVYRVPSLSLPDGETQNAADLSSSDAAALFAARAADAGFVLDDESAPLVASVCRRLDGIPLALELAAARLTSLSLPQVASRLDQRFRLLTGGSRNAMPRQQTLQATVDWSFSLLNRAERDTLTRLSVFAGGFDLAAAEEVADSDLVDSFDIADVLGSLVGKSLVVADRAAGSLRYRLLETIRQYSAEELLRAAGEDEVLRVQARHASWCLRLAMEAESGLLGPGQGDWLARLDAEWDNLRAAFTYLETEGRSADVRALAVGLARFAISRGHGSVLAWLENALQEPAQADLAFADALLTSVSLMQFAGRFGDNLLATEQDRAERALAIGRETGHVRTEAQSLALLGALAFLAGKPEGRRFCADAVALARSADDPHLLGDTLGPLAFGAPPAEARLIRLEALACYRESGDDLKTAIELQALYGLEAAEGRMEEAQAYLEEAISLAEPLGDEIFLYFFRSEIAMLLVSQGAYAEAHAAVRQCLITARRCGVPGGAAGTASLLLPAACCVAWQGDLERAARLHGASDAAIAAAVGDRTINWSDFDERFREREQSALRDQLGSQAYLTAWEAGQRLGPEQAVELALGRVTASRPATVSSAL
jgi:predicted ATPase/class 3 adenylate cyclase